MSPRLAVAAATAAALVAVVPVAPAAVAAPVPTTMVGRTALETATTSCPVGEVATGLTVTQDEGQDVVAGVQLECTPAGGQTAYVGGGADAPLTGRSACDAGDRVVGLHGSAGDVIDRLGVLCAHGPFSPTQVPAVGGSGGSSFSVACPEFSAIGGVQVWWDVYDNSEPLWGIQGLCRSETSFDITPPDDQVWPGQAVPIGLDVRAMGTGSPATGTFSVAVDGDQLAPIPAVAGSATVTVEAGVAPIQTTVGFDGDDSSQKAEAETVELASNVLTVPDGTVLGPDRRSTTACPVGATATGVTWHYTGDRYLRGAELACSGGTSGGYAGGTTLTTTPSSGASECATGERVVGLRMKYGRVMNAGRARCAAPGSATHDAALVPSAGGGTDHAPRDCPGASVLVGVTVWWEGYGDQDIAYAVQGICGDGDLPRVSGPSAPATVLEATSAFSWSGSDVSSGLDHYRLDTRVRRIGSATATTSSSETSLTTHAVRGLQPGSTVCLTVRGVDRVGNTSAGRSTCTARPADDRAATLTGKWARTRPTAAWNGTATVSSTRGAALALASRTRLVRVGVVASTCSSCGSVVVYVGSRRIGTIDLTSSATRHRVVKLLPAFAARAGAVRFVVVERGKTVTIDGVVAVAAP